MKKLLLPLLLILLFVTANAQNGERIYYYYNAQRVYYPVSYDRIVVGIKPGHSFSEIKNTFSTLIAVSKDSLQETFAGKQFMVKLGYNKVKDIAPYIAKLKQNPDVLFARPVFKTPSGKYNSYGEEFIINLKASTSFSMVQNLMQQTGCTVVRKYPFQDDMYILAAGEQSGYDGLAMANLFYETGLFDYAEPNKIVYNAQHTDPNDPLYNLQWSHKNTGSAAQYNGTVGADMKVQQAWQVSMGSATIKIGVIDEGVDLTHPDLQANLLQGFNGVTLTSNPGDGAPLNAANAHGTNCAGIISALANNGIGVAGVAPNCKIIPAVIFNAAGNYIGDAAVAGSFDYIRLSGADVISNSWGGGAVSATIDAAIDRAVTLGRAGKGCVVLFASGNDNSVVSYPATNPQVVAVGGINMCNQRKSPTSCDGETFWGANYGTGLDVVAPCVKIASTDIQGTGGYNTAAGTAGDYNNTFNGTSSATPNAAGVAALILSVNSSLTVAQARVVLESSCDKIPGYTFAANAAQPNGTWNNELGHGRVNALAAIQLALVCSRPTVTAPTVTQPACPLPAGTIVVNATGSGTLEYSLNGGAFQPSNTFSNLAPGGYFIAVRVQGGDPACMEFYNGGNPVVINQPASTIAFTVPTVTQPACPSPATGTIVVNATGGGALEYSLNGGAYQPNNTFSSLTPGNYNIMARLQGTTICTQSYSGNPVVITPANTALSTISYTGPVVAIPDGNATGVNIPLVVSGLGTVVSDLNFRLDEAATGTCDATIGNTNSSVNHTWVGDLVFKLTSPGGTTVTLISQVNGGNNSGNNFCTVLLDDEGGFSTIQNVTTAPVAGNFSPANPLSAFDGQNPNGTWTLNVSDLVGSDAGSVRRFSLVITSEAPCAAAPVITTTGTLTAFTACAGTASAEQTFTVAGSNLTANLTVTAPTGFEVSTTTGTGFGTSITPLVPSGGTVSTTTIFVRMAATATGTPAGNIACASTGATTQNVAASGTVNALPVITAPTVTPPTCATPTGTIVINATGTGTLEYALNNGTYQTSATFSGLAPNSYNITVRLQASPSCIATYSGNPVVLTAATGCCTPPVITPPTVTPPTCATPTGTIVINATGTGTLEYALNNGTYQSSATFSGLAPNSYNITVRLQASPSCIATYSGNPVVLTAATGCCTPPVITPPTVTPPTCATPTGTIVINATGTGTLEYALNNGTYQSSATFSGLAPNSYNITVRLQASPSCIATYSGNPVVLTAATGCCTPPVITPPTVTPPTCATPTGTIVINATGTGTLEYALNNGTYQSSATFSGLAPNSYNITVRLQASPSCIATYSGNPVVLTAATGCCTPPVITTPTVTPPTCATPTGTIVVNATGGGTLEYSINGGTNWFSSATFNALAAGSYNIQVRLQASPSCLSIYSSNPVVLNAATGCCITNPIVTNNNDAGAGSLRQAVLDACPGSTITFSGVTSPITLSTGEIIINKNLTITGPVASPLSVSGNNASRVFSITSNASVNINNLTITGGNAAGNTGGGIYNSGTGTTTLNNIVFLGNSAGSGGGLFNFGPATLTNVVFSNNTATSTGGALQNNGTFMTVILNNVVFSGNSVTGGAGLGGAIVNAAAIATFNNCTFYGNSATGTGGAMYNVNSSNTQIKNCIFRGNSAPAFADIHDYNANSITTITTSLFGTDPLFVNAADPDGADNLWITADDGLRLQSGSPAVNTGTAAGAPATDILGLARVGNTDMGAYELAVVPVITTTGTLAAFTACAGTASAEQTFTVSGTGLTANLTVTAPTGFEVSTTTGTGFGTSITPLVPSGGTVNTTTIFVRMAATATGTPAGNIACASTGATTQNVAASGTVNALPVITAPTVSQPTCSTLTGAIAVNATGSGALQYSLNNGPYQNSSLFLLLGPGSYNITVRLTASPTCIATYSGNPVVLTAATGCCVPPVITAPTVTQPTCATPTGTIVVHATTGIPPVANPVPNISVVFEFSVDNGNTWVPTNSFGNLSLGSYNIKVRLTANPTCIATYSGNPVVLTAATGCCVPPVITTPTVTQPTCDAPTGTIVVNATGGSTLEYQLNAGTFQLSNTFSGLAPGNYNITVRLQNSPACLATYSGNPIVINAVPAGTSTAYGGTRRPVPGRIEAEDYDNGGQGIGYNDGTVVNSGTAYRPAESVDVETCYDYNGGVYNIGWTSEGEWVKYSVHVNTTGLYTFTARVATPNGGKSIGFQVDCATIATVPVPFTGWWQTWQTTIPVTVPLTAGDHVFRFLFNTGDVLNVGMGFNINWFDLALVPNQFPTANAGVAQTVTLPATTATLSGSGAANNGGTITYAWTCESRPGGSPIPSIVSPTNPITGVSGLVLGSYVFRLTVTRNDGQTAFSEVTVTVIPANSSTPYGGVRRIIPGTLQAEEYDNGGQNTAYNDGTANNIGTAFRPAEAVDVENSYDVNGLYNVGWTTDGEWIQFSVHVNATALYNFTARVATLNTGKSIQLEVDGNPAVTLNVPLTGGWQAWQTTAPVSVNLTEGDHVFRFRFTTGNASDPNAGFNINWFSFIIPGYQPPTANAGQNQVITLPTSSANLSGSGTGTGISYAWAQTGGTAAIIQNGTTTTPTITGLTTAGVRTFRLTVTDNIGATATSGDVTVTVNAVGASTPYGGVRRPIPGTLQAEEYDNGGQNVAYNDGTANNIGTAFRPTEAVDLENCYDVNGVYNVGWTTDGEWIQFSVHVNTTGLYNFTARVATLNAGKSIQMLVDGVPAVTLNVPFTGAWQAWQTTAPVNVNLSQGDHVFRFQFTTGYADDPNGGFNINWFNFVLAAPPLTTPLITAAKLPANATAVQQENTTSDLQASVFPNPTSSHFNLRVQTKSMEQVTVRIIDIAGRQVQQLKGNPGQAMRFGDKMVNGTYFVEVRQGAEKVVLKVIKQ